MWIKICANTSLEDARHAIGAGADAVGFVFAAESKRRVTAPQVAAITAGLPASAEMIGVFVEQSVEEIVDIVQTAGLTGVQLHAGDIENAVEHATRLRERLAGRAQRLTLTHVLHFDPAEHGGFEKSLQLLNKNDVIDAVLVDSRTADAFGGTGVTFDWNEARRVLLSQAARLRLIVAGGLTPQNVTDAIGTLRPWGVDVASGVEITPGVKDAAKVENFISNARRADAGKHKGISLVQRES